VSVTRVRAVTNIEDDYALGGEITGALWKMEKRHFWHRVRNRSI
jgi:hypothetical protein